VLQVVVTPRHLQSGYLDSGYLDSGHLLTVVTVVSGDSGWGGGRGPQCPHPPLYETLPMSGCEDIAMGPTQLAQSLQKPRYNHSQPASQNCC